MNNIIKRLLVTAITAVVLTTLTVLIVSGIAFLNGEPNVTAADGGGYYKITVDSDKDFELRGVLTVRLLLESAQPFERKIKYFDGEALEPIKTGVENGRRYAVYELTEATPAPSLPYGDDEILDSFKEEMVNVYGEEILKWIFSIEDSFTGLYYRCTEKVYSVEKLKSSEPPKNPFTDVEEGRFYYGSVLWAVEAGITKGTTATTFEPKKPCTRAEVVTFLWRAKGQPAPQSSVNPFVDVERGKWYTEAVLWAVAEGITTGTSATTFEPTKVCTRAEVVTFLWRTVGEHDSSGAENPFVDVERGKWFTEAVLWAVAEGITTGTSATTFEPTLTCDRGQIVTFLSRAAAER